MSRWIALVLVVAACKDNPGPSCGQIADHMIVVMKQLPGHEDQQLADRNQMIAQCEKRDYPRTVRKCLVAAKTLDDLSICQRAEPPPRREPGSAGSAR
jgi:hypothetical protein